MIRHFAAGLAGCAPALLLLLAGPANSAAPGDATTWYSILAADGARVGHASHETRQSGERRETIEGYVILVQEPEQPARSISERTVMIEGADGRPISIIETSQTGRDWARTEAVIHPDRADIVRQTRSDTPDPDRPAAGRGPLRQWRRPAAQLGSRRTAAA